MSFDALGIMNKLAGVAHKKAQKPKYDPDKDGDDDSSEKGDKDKDFAGKKSPKKPLGKK